MYVLNWNVSPIFGSKHTNTENAILLCVFSEANRLLLLRKFSVLLSFLSLESKS